MTDPIERTSAYRDPDPPSARARWNPRAQRAFAYATASVALVPATFVAIATLFERMRFGGNVTLLTLVAAAVATLWLAVAGIRRARAVLREVPSLPEPERGRGLAIPAIMMALVGLLFSLLGFFAAWLSTMNFSRGRQLRHRGRLLLAPVEEGGRWTSDAMAIEVDVSHRDAVAARWRENGRTEHASVAAFARVSLDLIALGAPPALIAAAHRDALDEVRHTELCFSLARAIDGRSVSPGAFSEAREVPPRSASRHLALASLAVDSLIDGALHEGVSARVIAKLARRCEEPTVHSVLKELAADEGRHAAHGWEVVTWCLDEGGHVVARALLGALAALPPTMRSPLPEGAADGSWERWGIHGHALEAEEYTRALADLGDRVRRLCVIG